MALSSTLSDLEFTGNASTVTAYALTGLRYDAGTWLQVSQVDADGAVTALTEGTHYTLGGDGTAGTGTLTSTSGNAIPATDTLRVRRIAPATQSEDLEQAQPLDPKGVEGQLDKMAMSVVDTRRQIAELEERSIRVPDGETLTELPNAANRAGKFLAFDVNGDPDLINSEETSAAEAAVSAAAAAASAAGASISADAASDHAAAALIVAERSEFVGTLDLALINPDGLPNGTHPSVVMIDGGIAGYQYWMVYTPFPNATREDPAVVCSHDGQKWVVPPGKADAYILPSGWKTANSVQWCADTHLMVANDGTLVCYFIGNTSVGGDFADIWRTVSSDGVTWSAPVMVVARGTDQMSKNSSPVVEYGPDGTTLYMFTCNYREKIGSGYGEAGIYRRTSADDGATWTSPTSCTFPEHAPGQTDIDCFKPWNLDAKLVGDRWHMLCGSSESSLMNKGRVFYLWSDDNGLTWEGDVVKPCIDIFYNTIPEFAVLGTGYDPGPPVKVDQIGFVFERHYRACFLPIPGDPLDWKVWITSASDNLDTPSDVNDDQNWHIMMLDRVVLSPHRRRMTFEEMMMREEHTQRFTCSNELWRMVGSAVSPPVISGSTQHTLAITLAGASTSEGFATPYGSGSGYAPAYVAPGNDRTLIDWRNRYEIVANFMYTSDTVDAYFLLGVSNVVTIAGGFTGRMAGFAVSEGQVFAVANRLDSDTKINVETDGILVADLMKYGGEDKGKHHSVRMIIRGDGTADFIINGHIYPRVGEMPHTKDAPNPYGLPGNILPGVRVKYRSGAYIGSQLFYVNRFDVACTHITRGADIPIRRYGP